MAAAAEVTRSHGMVLTARAENHLYGSRIWMTRSPALSAYRQAGADVVYAPWLADIGHIARVVSETAPVNVLARVDGPDVAELATVGVRRVSTGGALAFAAYGALATAARELLSEGTSSYIRRGSRWMIAVSVRKVGIVMPDLIGALDQGTTSTRFMIFDHDGESSRSISESIARSSPARVGGARPGRDLVDDDIGHRGRSPCRAQGIRARGRRSHQSTGDDGDMGSDDRRARAQRNRLAGHTNRRPLCRASRGRRPRPIQGEDRAPLATYFSGPKARYLLDRLDLGERAERGELAFGTIDSWIAWNLSGGPKEDVTSPMSPTPRAPFSWTWRRRPGTPT